MSNPKPLEYLVTYRLDGYADQLTVEVDSLDQLESAVMARLPPSAEVLTLDLMDGSVPYRYRYYTSVKRKGWLTRLKGWLLKV